MTVSSMSDFRSSDVDLVGGKGANLGELINNGFPIPPGFVVCSDEYVKVISELGEGHDVDDFKNAIKNWKPSPDFLESIRRCHEALQSARTAEVVYAVRSSATAEDLGDASFAGQHETYYYVTFTDLVDNLKRCWVSLWSDEAIAYRDTQGIEHQTVLMAVVVQEMIPSDVSGITFTANPLSGDLDEIVSDATWGMGAAIVDGRVTPDHYVVLRDSDTVSSHRIANKIRMVSTTRQVDGDRMIDVPYHRQKIPCLNDDQILEVTHWALKAEQHFDSPQDLEWAIYDGDYYMLQSRPITTLSDHATEEKETRKLVLFKAVSENFTESLLPLSVDVLGHSIPNPFHNGRIYQEIAPARLLLPIKMTDEQAAELVSWELPEDFKIRINWLMLPFSVLTWFIIYLIAGVDQARSRGMPDDFMEVFRKHEADIDANDDIGPAEAMVRLFFVDKLIHPTGMDVMTHNITSVLRYFSLMGILNKLLSIWIPDVQRDAGSLLCSGSYGVKSTEMGRNIFKLSIVAKEHSEVVDIFRTYPPDELLDVLKANGNAGTFLTAFDDFLATHGHRALKEFELASPRFAENPAPVLAMIKNYMLSDSNPDEMEQHTTDNRVELAQSIQAKLAAKPLESIFPWRWKLIEYLADKARYFIKLRENTRFYHIMGWNVARKKILRAEEKLISNGKLKVKDDIFYLRWVEVRALLDDELQWSDIEETVRARRMMVLRWNKQSVPKLLNIESRHTKKILSKGQLGGQGAAPGQFEGVARVILDPSVDAEIHPGEILVAPYTDPAWTPLFLIARAAVVGVGSYLSHAGTIAREYGMPCVVDVQDCTSLIRTGDRILVDGTEGIVHILKDEEVAA